MSDSARTIECAEIRLLSSSDHAPPVFIGPGYITIPAHGHITFTMFAGSSDPKLASRSLAESHKDPHDHWAQFRLQATDYQAIEWVGGWTRPELKGFPKIGYPLTGVLQGLTVGDSGPHVSQEAGVELLFVPAPWVPLEKSMVTTSTIEGAEIETRISGGLQALQVLGADIAVGNMPSGRALWLAASTSDELRHPYAERWLSEPLRVLLGQLVYPRLTARNFGDGRATVQLTRVPRFGRQPTDVSLLGERSVGASEQFWDLYKRLLTITAMARGSGGDPNFDEVHPVTRYYEEIVQAAEGSLWVLCMTLAGAAEGLVRMLNSSGNLKVDTELKALSTSGAITRDQQRTWTAVRHEVMHGKLISPWPEKETMEQIQELMELVRRLTHRVLQVQAA